MRCWNCKQDMPDGLKYCGHCGVHMKRSVHILQLLFTGKGLIVTLAVLLVVAGVFLSGRLLGNVELIDVDMGCYTPGAEDVVYEDDGKSYGYVKNMLLVFVTRDATDRQIMRAVNRVDGEIVGVLPGLRQYQIRVATNSLDELEDLRLELMEYDFVKAAIIDTVAPVEQEVTGIPDDPWYDYTNMGFDTDWNEDNPDGTNWWVEATRILSAWNYQDDFSNIKVGIVDGGFDLSHEDLKITVLNRALNDADDHGTHVAGIIGATHNNGVGISGVLSEVELYGVDCFQSSDLLHQANISTLLGGIDLCLSQGCRVVNMSAGLEYGHPDAVQQIAVETALYLIMMLDSYDQDFLIVQAAGNGNNEGRGVDAETYNGFFASINAEIVALVLQELDAMGVELEHNITVEDVMSSFLVVGNVDYERSGSNYQLAASSNYGRNVTICAPGRMILSTFPQYNNYEYLNGTSMAAPVVSGIAAMVWSVDQDMTAAQVKDIILSTANEPVLPRQPEDTGRYYIVNAEAAVEKALGARANKPESPMEEGSFWDWFRNLFLWFREDEEAEDTATQPTEETTVMPTEEPTDSTNPVDFDVPEEPGALLKHSTTHLQYTRTEETRRSDYTYDNNGAASEIFIDRDLDMTNVILSEFDEIGRLSCRTIHYDVHDNYSLYAERYYYEYNTDGQIIKIVCDGFDVYEITFFYNEYGRLQRCEYQHEDGYKGVYECELYNNAIYMKLVSAHNQEYRYGRLVFLDSIGGVYAVYSVSEQPIIVNGYVVSAVLDNPSLLEEYFFEYEDSSAEDPKEATEPLQDLSGPGYWVPVAQQRYAAGQFVRVDRIQYSDRHFKMDGDNALGSRIWTVNVFYSNRGEVIRERKYSNTGIVRDENGHREVPEESIMGYSKYTYDAQGYLTKDEYTVTNNMDASYKNHIYRVLGYDYTVSHIDTYSYDSSGALVSVRTDYENGAVKIYACENFRNAYTLYHDNILRIQFMCEHGCPGYRVDFKNGYVKEVSPEGYILTIGIKNSDEECHFIYDTV